MKLIPRTLLGQNALLLVVVLVVSQAMAWAVLSGLVLRPQTRYVAKMFAHNITTIAKALDQMPPDKQEAVLNAYRSAPYIKIVPERTPPPDDGGWPSLLERTFMRELLNNLETQSSLLWRTDSKGQLWINMVLGAKHYWITMKIPRAAHANDALVGSVLLVLVLAGSVGMLVQHRLGKPLRLLARAADTVASSGPAVHIKEQGPAEVVAVSRSFNAMTKRLAQAEADRTLMLAGVSHDLRTPLSKLRLAVALLAGRDAELEHSITQNIAEMDLILNQFLDFARSIETEPVVDVDLSALIDEAMTTVGISGTHPVDPIIHPGRPHALRRALVNLLENARRYGAPPFEVSVLRAAQGAIFITVIDHGPGAPEEMISRLTAPFVRADETRTTGVGLGLAIVERIAMAHGGALTLSNRPEGGFQSCLMLS